MRTLSRRHFLGALPGLAALVALAPGRGRASTHAACAPGAAREPRPSPRLGDHPDPRPGVDASEVLTGEQLADTPHAIPVYDGIREIPEIADGIRCYCGCADLPGYRSLLTCYEGGGMARYCDVCQGQGWLAHRRWKEGQSLDQIRRAMDARFGRGGEASLAGRSTAHR